MQKLYSRKGTRKMSCYWRGSEEKRIWWTQQWLSFNSFEIPQSISNPSHVCEKVYEYTPTFRESCRLAHSTPYSISSFSNSSTCQKRYRYNHLFRIFISCHGLVIDTQALWDHGSFSWLLRYWNNVKVLSRSAPKYCFENNSRYNKKSVTTFVFGSKIFFSMAFFLLQYLFQVQ